MMDIDTKEQLEWKWKLHAEPANMKIRKGAAVSHGDTAYFHPRDSQKVLQYKNKWDTLPECPQENFGLAVVDDLLTAVGGKVDGVAVNHLTSFIENEWKQQFSAMSTKREMPAVIRVNDFLIAAGGKGEGGDLSSVEVMNIKTREWHHAPGLPEPVYAMSATVAREHLYLLGGYGKHGPTPAVFVCPIDSLINPPSESSPDVEFTASSKPGAEEATVWYRAADLPVKLSTCVTLSDRVVTIGGSDSDGSSTDVVHMYDPQSWKWSVVGFMPTARSECLAVTMQKSVITAGGYSTAKWFKKVEVGLLQLPAMIEHSDLEFYERLGGGTAAVYRGRWKSEDTVVAVKRMLELTNRELRIQNSLDHPNVIRLYGAVYNAPVQFGYCIVTAYAENGSLYNYLHVRKENPGLEQGLKWAKQVAEAMQYIHQRGYAHRDLKSDNVVLTSNLTAKVCDLGSAKTLEKALQQSTIVGSYAYMAPEMVRREEVSNACDVYSYGVLLREIITHEMPAVNMGKIYEGKTECPPAPKDCEPYLAKLMEQCWKEKAKERPTFERILTILRSEAELEALIEYSDLADLEEVGEGGFGKVWKGEWKSKGKTVAIKQVTGMVKNEVKILRSLSHPYVICFYGVVANPPKLAGDFIVTEFAEKLSIYDYFHKRKDDAGTEQSKEKELLSTELNKEDPSAEQRENSSTKQINNDQEDTSIELKWAMQIAEGMQYLHQKDIVHRDLKSSNVVLMADLTAKICDMGSAQTLKHSRDEAGLIGTYAWMAPEVMKNEPVTKQSDVYSYGVVLWELMTHKVPFPDLTGPAVMSEVLAGQHPEIPDSCEEYLQELMKICWSRISTERPQFTRILASLQKKTFTTFVIPYDDLEVYGVAGSGRFGTVFRGQWKPMNRVVAIKIMMGVQLREVQLQKLLVHPNIIQFYGTSSVAGVNYLIFEFAGNGSVYDYIHRRQNKPSLEQCLVWAQQTAQGMLYVHECDILHRDLKSSNVLLTDKLVAKICDFGSARSFSHSTTRQTITPAGTLAWLSPEVLNGEVVSKASDVYSFGVLLFELVTQQIPYPDTLPIMVAFLVLDGKRPQIPENCEPYLAKLMEMCWDEHPKKRPSFENILKILERRSTAIESTESAESTKSADEPQ